ncbi:MAG: hypothetical protein QOH74_1057, partial [Gaiellales bacterium]|nr:hypothetical protein [Gaiellales bacterium]
MPSARPSYQSSNRRLPSRREAAVPRSDRDRLGRFFPALLLLTLLAGALEAATA